MTDPEVVTPEQPTLAPVSVRRSRGPLLLVGSLVLALLLGVGGWAGLSLMAGTGPQAAEITPGNVVAFAAVDLTPGLGQQRKLANLLAKFPKAFDDGDVRVDDKDLTADVTPWLGGRFGAAMWMHNSQAYTLFVAASRDDRKAREGLERLRGREGSGKFGFVVGDGYVVAARGTRDAQAAAEAAHAEAQATPLAGVAAYADAVKWLPEEHFAHAYADLAGLNQAMTTMIMSDLGDLGESEEAIPEDAITEVTSSGFFTGVPGLTGKQKGTLIVGANAVDGGVEVHYRTFGAAGTESVAPTADLIAAVGDLSADSAVAGSVAIAKAPAELEGMFGAPMLDPEDFDPEDFEGLTPEDIAAIKAEMAKGPDFAKAFKALDSSLLTFAMTGMQNEMPVLFATLQTKDATAAGDVAAAAKATEIPLKVTVSGNTVRIVSDGYTASAKLSGSPLFTKAIEGLPSHPDSLVYVDLTKFLSQTGADARTREMAAPIKAIAAASTPLGADSEGTIRLVIE
ncbi:MAG: hypothetical protein HOU81_25020 [Hamadaea sp.]|uniref:hypothetical protein n=1 Tax=Hamadaea sp. TaxID=2024425 RepID=UPI0017E9CDFF|nr:hypothetical protein [Hamadaea sp.]NUR74085.1 hypothetical protein [Hamadaea sp.]NUT20229.1 hypothetical protein [Hamadaea sp.]